MSAADGEPIEVAGVRVTSPLRVLFDELGLTKEALARYYESVSAWMLPELRDRPLSLVRCPQGPGGGCFYQKHIDAAWSDEIERVIVPESDGEGVYPVANSAAAVVGLVQKGVIELHVAGATTRDLAKPDRMVFDFDPDTELPWREVTSAARTLREVLADAGLESFVRLRAARACTWRCRSRRRTTGTR
jgi:bifunctional non-homologous end joining protein LigD